MRESSLPIHEVKKDSDDHKMLKQIGWLYAGEGERENHVLMRGRSLTEGRMRPPKKSPFRTACLRVRASRLRKKEVREYRTDDKEEKRLKRNEVKVSVGGRS